MEVGWFDFEPPDPPLRNPHALVMLRPWINVGNVGSIVLSRLASIYESKEIAQLRRPGHFYDFTRYRPEMKWVDGEREITTPNTKIEMVRRPEEPDLVLVHLLEPHSNSEDFNESVLAMLEALGVTTYISVGGMYDSVPHSRPLLVTGSSRGWEIEPDLSGVTLSRSRYEGPTSATNGIGVGATQRGLATLTVMVHLPMYLQLDNDYAGAARAIEALAPLYGLKGMKIPEVELGEQQYAQVTPAMSNNPRLAEMVNRFEVEYDSRDQDDDSPPSVELPPEIERFLDEVRGGDSEDGQTSGGI
ncbi:MAG: PAC2 family protein [Chloroflexi bacterium]|nr:PAC2 family protein [Chloroflexota bacterium]